MADGRTVGRDWGGVRGVAHLGEGPAAGSAAGAGGAGGGQEGRGACPEGAEGRGTSLQCGGGDRRTMISLGISSIARL